MDFLIDVFVGTVVVVLLVLAGLGVRRAVRYFRRERAKDREFEAQLDELRMNRRSELERSINEAATRGALDALEQEVSRSGLPKDDIANLRILIQSRRKQFDRDEEGVKRMATAKAEVEPRMTQFRKLYDIDDPDVLFYELHRIVASDEGVVSLLRDFTYFEDERGWLVSRYDELLLIRMRGLVALTLERSPRAFSAYKEAKRLRCELYGRYDYQFERLIGGELHHEWNAMIVRFNPEPAWDDFIGVDRMWNEFSEKGFDEIFEQARSGDLQSLQVVRLLLDEGDDDFHDFLVALAREEVDNALDIHYGRLWCVV